MKVDLFRAPCAPSLGRVTIVDVALRRCPEDGHAAYVDDVVCYAQDTGRRAAWDGVAGSLAWLHVEGERRPRWIALERIADEEAAAELRRARVHATRVCECGALYTRDPAATRCLDCAHRLNTSRQREVDAARKGRSRPRGRRARA